MMGTMDTPCAFQLIPAGKIILLVAVVVEVDVVVIALVDVVRVDAVVQMHVVNAVVDAVVIAVVDDVVNVVALASFAIVVVNEEYPKLLIIFLSC
jgi:hypothetical protein